MRKRKEFLETTNRSVFNKLYKYYLSIEGDIHCDRCPYHWGENHTHHLQKSWKKKSKNKRQFLGEYEKYALTEENDEKDLDNTLELL